MTDNTPRVAIVTGAARGIGAATALRLAADGLAVAALDLDEATAKATVDAIEAAGGRALAVGADVADADQVAAAVERVAAGLGAPTVLVNNAGVTRDNLLFKMTEGDWDTYVAARAAQIPVAKAGQVEDIAHAVSFFVSEGAGFVSGQVLYVAGGPRA